MTARLRSWDAAALIAIAIALAALLPGIGWGLPTARDKDTTDPWGYDEMAPLSPLIEARGLFRTQPKENAYLPYPLFHYVVLAVSYVPYLGYEYLAGHFRPAPTYPYGMSDPVQMCAALTLIARGVAVLMAVGTVWFLYRIGLLIGVQRWVACGMASAVALMPPFIYYGRTSNHDMPYIFWTVAALHAAAEVLFAHRLGPSAFVRFGVFAALAMASKDQAIAFLIVVPPLFLIAIGNALYRERPLRTRLWAALFHRPLWLGLAASVAAFALANNLLFGWSGFLEHIRQTLQYPTMERKWGTDLAGQAGLLGDTLVLLALSVGPLGVFALLGLIDLIRARRGMVLAFLLLPSVAHQFLVLGKIGYCYSRFVILPGMFVLLLASCAFRPGVARGVAFARGAIVLLGFAYLAFAAVDMNRGQVFDARYVAEAFLAANARAGQTVETYARYARLAPRLPEEVKLTLVPLADMDESKLAARHPDFILIMDLSDVGINEGDRLTPFGAALLGGQLGYRVVFDRQSPSVLGRRFIRCVAPHVTILRREASPQ